MWPKTKPAKFIIWGNEHYSTTHSYIHYGYFHAATYLGWDVEWVGNTIENQEKYSHCNEYLFVTEGNGGQHIPKNPNAFYILHNCNMELFKMIPEINIVIQQVFTKDVFERNIVPVKTNKYEYWQPDANTFYMPWATDLLPNEVNENIKKIQSGLLPIKSTNRAFFLGTSWSGFYGNINELELFREGCKSINIPFECNTSTTTTQDETIVQLQNALITPSIVGTWQKEKGYIPCRIFKTVSYGQIGCTNSKEAYECLNQLVIYDSDERNIAKLALNKCDDINYRISAMEFVRDNHTYVQRLESLQYIFQIKTECKSI